jgi:hypothetical protein
MQRLHYREDACIHTFLFPYPGVRYTAFLRVAEFVFEEPFGLSPLRTEVLSEILTNYFNECLRNWDNIS